MVEHKIRTMVLLVLLVSVFAVPIAALFAINLPAQAQYNKAFGGQVVIIENQPTTYGMAAQLEKLWVQMNDTFGTTNQNTTYNSGWYWDYTPDNSIAAESIFFHSELQRLDNYSALYTQYVKAGNTTVTGLPINDWYGQVVNESRGELTNGGGAGASGHGLDWVINGAWYLKYSPAAYWDWNYFFWYDVFAIVGMIALIVTWPRW